jgi:GxxExxY protein
MIEPGNALSRRVIGAAISVHRELGPGAVESVYEKALSSELAALGIDHECQIPLEVKYKEALLDCGYRMDVVVEQRLVLEFKSVEALHPIHDAQLLTYLRLSGHPLGLLMNFDVPVLKEGLKRLINSPKQSSVQPGSFDPGTQFDPLSSCILNAAKIVHVELGPGLLRSTYEACLRHELALQDIASELGKKFGLEYRGRHHPSAVEARLLIDEKVPVMCLSVKTIEPLHLARLRTLLKASALSYGLILNFNGKTLNDQIRRIEAP